MIYLLTILFWTYMLIFLKKHIERDEEFLIKVNEEHAKNKRILEEIDFSKECN